MIKQEPAHSNPPWNKSGGWLIMCSDEFASTRAITKKIHFLFTQNFNCFSTNVLPSLLPVIQLTNSFSWENRKTTSSKWRSGQLSPAWPRLCLRLRKTTGLNLLSRFHWVKLREWRESYFPDRKRWGFWLKPLMETSKLTWWDNYKREAGGGGVTIWHYLLPSCSMD